MKEYDRLIMIHMIDYEERLITTDNTGEIMIDQYTNITVDIIQDQVINTKL